FPRSVDSVGSFSNVRFYQLPPEKPRVVVEPPPETVVPVEADYVEKPVSKRPPFLMIGVGIGAALSIVLVGLLLRHRGEPEKVSVAARPVVAVSQLPRLALQSFTVESTDPAAVKAADAARRCAQEILRTLPGVQFVEDSQPGARVYGATIHGGAAGTEMVPTAGGAPLGGPISMTSAGAAVGQLIERIAQDAKVSPPTLNADAVGSLIAALEASGSDSRPDRARAVASLKAALQADPGFLAAQRLGVDIFEKSGDHADAIAAARKVIELDPADRTTSQKLTDWYKQSGDPGSVLDVYRSILRAAPDDREALAGIGRYALSAADANSFSRVLGKISAKTDGSAVLFAPDILLATGHIDAAAQKYYDCESADPRNATLSLTIGRLAVLRRSLPIAAIEIGKLEKLDPAYGAHLLKAYVEAQNGRATTAIDELNAAASAPKVGPDFFTSSAEVYALLNQPQKVLESLKKAVDGSEPTTSYIISNPIFRYLQADPAWPSLSSRLGEQRRAVAARLGTLSL
ncbi:MAG TPA: hypothetical protein VHL58_11615, partial [Thermoanaerobaculia bacterium]|nr:hypothetical protein [Thermoanaerobaculia bacterium]